MFLQNTVGHGRIGIVKVQQFIYLQNKNYRRDICLWTEIVHKLWGRWLSSV